MAVGDDAQAKGFPLVPDTGENGRVRYGAREINRTRDLVAQTLDLIPVAKSEYREKSGISSGTATPNNADGADGDIYFKVL